MILLSCSKAVLEKFDVNVVSSSLLVSSTDWHRFWRADLRRIKGVGEVLFFTNKDTLYTLVADPRGIRDASALEQHFLFRLRLLFDGNLGFTSNSWESVLMHRAADQSLQGSMNSFFRIIDSSSSVPALDDLEPWLNSFPAASREFRSPKEMLQKRVRKTA